MGILGNLFGGNSEDGGYSDLGARISLASQVLMAMDRGQVANIAPAVADLNAQRRKYMDQAKSQKWLQAQAAGMADKNPRLAAMLENAPPGVGESLISKYLETQFQPPDWKTFESQGDVYRYDQGDPNSKPSMFFDGPAAAPTGEMAQYENDQQMRTSQGLPRQSFADWNVSTLAPAKPPEWENKYNAVVADMKKRGVPDDQIPTIAEFLDDGLKITTNPDGTTTVSQGGTGNKAPTEGDLRSKQIVTSMVSDIPAAITGFDEMSSFASTAEGLGANFLNDENSQATLYAITNVATNAVYAISGQGTTEVEMERRIKSMVPVPGDKPKALRDKKKRLIDAVKSMTSRAGVTLADLGIDPSLFEAPPSPEKKQQDGFELDPSKMVEGKVYAGDDGKDYRLSGGKVQINDGSGWKDM
jgi:hypothetical protein